MKTSNQILKRISVKNISDKKRGVLDVAELRSIRNFETKRIYYITNVPKGTHRGAHAHKSLAQIFFALVGKYRLTVTDGIKTETVVVKAHDFGYYLPAGHWRIISEFSPDAVCLVLASKHFDPKDYINSFDDFLRWRNIGHN